MTHNQNSHFFLLAVALVAMATTVAAAGNSTERDPNKDPIGGFVPKKVPSVLGIILYGASAIIHWTQYVRVKPRWPFMLTLCLGMTAMCVGFILRLVYSSPPFTLGKYIAFDLFILLSPCLFLATDYMILSHLARMFGDEVSQRLLIVRASLIVKVFVWSDVTTFFLQSSGGGLTAISNPHTVDLGNKIAMIGLVLQAVSFGFFMVVLLIFGFRMSKQYPELWKPKNPAPVHLLSTEPIEDWRILFYVTCATCIGIMIRSGFRIAEFAGGFNGRVATHEAYFYFLDALPLWISMSLYCFLWPPRVLNGITYTRSQSIPLHSDSDLARRK